MTMPLDLVLVRHGESEGNLANKRSRDGDHSAFTESFMNRHSSKFHLTNRGIVQARATGDWIKAHIGAQFDRYYVSEYTRAKETAGHMRLNPPNGWFAEFYLRERDWGSLDIMPENERSKRFAEFLERRDLAPLYWPPPNGLSIAELCLYADRVLQTLHRECAGKRVIIVCHGEVMWAFRLRIERMSERRYNELDASKHPFNHIHNCQLLHYTRCDPQTGAVTPYVEWMRSVCPWDFAKSRNSWERIVRPRYSDDDLLRDAELTPRILNE